LVQIRPQFLVIVVTDRHTDTQTNAGKTYSHAFAGRTNSFSCSTMEFLRDYVSNTIDPPFTSISH